MHNCYVKKIVGVDIGTTDGCLPRVHDEIEYWHYCSLGRPQGKEIIIVSRDSTDHRLCSLRTTAAVRHRMFPCRPTRRSGEPTNRDGL